MWCEIGEVSVAGMRVGCLEQALGRRPDGAAICALHLRSERLCPEVVGTSHALCARSGATLGADGFWYCAEHATGGRQDEGVAS
jgi:hypothetical protein